MPHLDAYDRDGIDDEPEEGDADEEYAARVRAEAELDERDAGGGGRKKRMPDAFAGVLKGSRNERVGAFDRGDQLIRRSFGFAVTLRPSARTLGVWCRGGCVGVCVGPRARGLQVCAAARGRHSHCCRLVLRLSPPSSSLHDRLDLLDDRLDDH